MCVCVCDDKAYQDNISLILYPSFYVGTALFAKLSTTTTLFSLHASFIANSIYLTSDSKALGSHGFVSGSMQGVNVVVRTTDLNKIK